MISRDYRTAQNHALFHTGRMAITICVTTVKLYMIKRLVCSQFCLLEYEAGICIGNSMICCVIWHKYHEWYFKIVSKLLCCCLFSKLFYISSRAVRRVKFGAILKYHKWYLCQISRTIHAIIYTITWEIQLSNAMCLFLSSCFASSASKLVLKFLFSAQLVQTLSQVDVLFSIFWFSEFSFSSWISWFQNLEIFPPFLRNSCDEIIWWFGVTIVTVIFTCRYFKLSWNTSGLS